MWCLNNGIAFTVVVLLGYFTISVLSLQPAKCKGKEIKSSEKDMTVLKDCVKDVGGADDFNDVPKEKFPCVGKCILSKQGLLCEKGMPVKAKIIKMINETMPAEVIPDLSAAIGKCVDDFGKVDATEENCMSYQPLCECIMKSYLTICSEGNKGGKAA